MFCKFTQPRLWGSCATLSYFPIEQPREDCTWRGINDRLYIIYKDSLKLNSTYQKGRNEEKASGIR